MRIFKIALISGFLLVSLSATSQSDTLDRRKIQEVSLNMTAVVSQFVPFGRVNTRTGPFNINWLRGSNNKFFRLSLGANLTPDQNGNISDDSFFNFGVGYTKRSKVWKNFYYDKSFLFMGYGGNLNIPNSQVTNSGAVGIGVGFGPGYQINERLRVSTEIIMFIGAGEVFNFVFVPPVGLNLSLVFFKS